MVEGAMARFNTFTQFFTTLCCIRVIVASAGPARRNEVVGRGSYSLEGFFVL